ncbi:unnamed protein product [Darwinula stevensoni]|uniref:Protein disulfide-isomerase n=1 Tax=Darwinula stevensoni TaxID=69355 RepID=A0A7R8X7K0_9CRUS|nr:unnamed protein product [Darwinula stevensoni]CAG0883405.1 unnamed protein product [Darwinula stevensoni]
MDFCPRGIEGGFCHQLAAMAPIERATLRPIVYYEFLQGHSARAAAYNICAAFEGNVVHWLKRFESGDTTFGDRPRSGRPSTVDDEALRNALDAKPNATIRDSATTLGVTHMAIGNHLNDLGYRKVYSTWVPHRLGDSDKASRGQKLLAHPVYSGCPMKTEGQVEEIPRMSFYFEGPIRKPEDGGDEFQLRDWRRSQSAGSKLSDRLAACRRLYLRDILQFLRIHDLSSSAEPPIATNIPIVEGVRNFDIPKEDGILVLNQETFNQALISHKFVLVEFYAPWCGHCQALAPEYIKAAKELKGDKDIALAKVDATLEKPLAQQYNIQGFPTLIFFHDGLKVEDYDGPRTADGIVQYMKVRLDPEWKPPPSSVLVLIAENFTTVMNAQPLMLLEFYAPWCAHCQRFAPEYEGAAKELLPQGIPLAKVDGTVEKSIADQYGISGWPTLKVSRHGRMFDYKGPRDKSGIVSYMLDLKLPPSTEVSSIQELQNKLSRVDGSVIAFFYQKSNLYDEYMAAAFSLKLMEDQGNILHTFSSEILEKYKTKPDTIAAIIPKALISKYEKQIQFFGSKGSTESYLVKEIQARITPLVGHRTKKNAPGRYRKRPLLVAYYEVNFSHEYVKDTNFVREKLVEVAKDYPDHAILFAVSDETEFEDELVSLGLADSGVDVNVALWDDKDKKYVMEPTDNLDSDDIREFISLVQAGKVKPYLKSEPIPRNQEGSVRVVVASTFEEEILKPEKDVLIEFYAPWCGHCKELEPIYERVAQHVAKSNDKLVLAKFDATANDVPPGFDVKGIPTIYFLPAFEKKDPILFDGPRTFEGINEGGMGPKKKNPINGFSIFMREQRDEMQRREGRVFRNMEEVVVACRPRWNLLAEEDKQRYNDAAKKEREKEKKDLTKKYDSYGMPLSERIREENEKKAAERAMIEDIRRTVQDGFNKGTLVDELFHFIDFNIFVRTDEIHHLVDKYRPAEVAAVEYTISQGVTKKLHALLHPDNIPLGYRSQAQDFAAEHGIRLELQGNLLEKNYPGIVIRLLNLLNPSGDKAEYPPFYTMPDQVEKVTSLLEWLWMHGQRRGQRNPFRVYQLNHLLFHLRAVCTGENLAYPSSVTATDVLLNSSFDHVGGIACKYHREECESTRPCVLSLVVRQAYLISDAICEHFGVELQPNKHCPVLCETPYLSVDEDPGRECHGGATASAAHLDQGDPDVDNNGAGFHMVQHNKKPIGKASVDGGALPTALKMSRPGARMADPKKVSSELFTLTYGALVAQMLRDYENTEEVNKNLEKLGWSIGVRLIEDFLARSGSTKCYDLKDTAEKIQAGFRMFLGVSPSISNWSPSGDEFSLFLDSNPLTDFVELPPSQAALKYSNIIPGVIRGACEMVHLEVQSWVSGDPLKGDDKTEIRVKFLRRKSSVKIEYSNLPEIDDSELIFTDDPGAAERKIGSADKLIANVKPLPICRFKAKGTVPMSEKLTMYLPLVKYKIPIGTITPTIACVDGIPCSRAKRFSNFTTGGEGDAVLSRRQGRDKLRDASLVTQHPRASPQQWSHFNMDPSVQPLSIKDAIEKKEEINQQGKQEAKSGYQGQGTTDTPKEECILCLSTTKGPNRFKNCAGHASCVVENSNTGSPTVKPIQKVGRKKKRSKFLSKDDCIQESLDTECIRDAEGLKRLSVVLRPLGTKHSDTHIIPSQSAERDGSPQLEEGEQEDESLSELEEETTGQDPFDEHLGTLLPEQFVKSSLFQSKKWKVEEIELQTLGHCLFYHCPEEASPGVPSIGLLEKDVGEAPLNLFHSSLLKDGSVFPPPERMILKESFIKAAVTRNLPNSIKATLKQKGKSVLSDLQRSVFHIINSYTDLLFTERTHSNGEELRFIYCLHAINHALKTRTKIVNHNAKLEKWRKKKKTGEEVLEYQDQGLARPKILIVVPFRESALRVVTMMSQLLFPDDHKGNIINKKKFLDHFESEDTELVKRPNLSDDFRLTFAGNIDDAFNVGLNITKSAIRLFSDLKTADIIVASPLGLRVLIGAEGDKERKTDFLASIEILILDQPEVFLMQNWEHMTQLFKSLHLQPRDTKEIDFSRVRMWSINGWARYYCQTLIFTSIITPEILSVFNRHCTNYEGKLCTANPITVGSVSQVIVQVPQVFQKFLSTDPQSDPDDRFQFFINKVLPQYKESLMAHTMIYIPSYFDFVQLRNYFKKEEISFTQLCEYSDPDKIARARNRFYHSKRHFLLYSERLHFYKRYCIKGIRHLIFYGLPTFPNFYSEILNFMQVNLVVWDDLGRYVDGGPPKLLHLLLSTLSYMTTITPDEKWKMELLGSRAEVSYLYSPEGRRDLTHSDSRADQSQQATSLFPPYELMTQDLDRGWAANRLTLKPEHESS